MFVISAALLVVCPVAAADSSATPSSWVFAIDGSVGVQVTPSGAVSASVMPLVGSARANYSLGTSNGRSLQTALLPSSPLGPSACKVSGDGVTAAAAGGSVSLAQAWACTAPHPLTQAMVSLAVTVTDVYSPGLEAVDITTTIHVDRTDVPFTAGIGMALTPAGVSQFWTTWAKGCVQNNGRGHGMCFAPDKPWSQPFSSEPLSEATIASYRYGTGGADSNDTFALPIVTLLDGTKDAALSLALSPEVQVHHRSHRSA